LLRQAKNRFAQLEFNNIETRLGDGSLGWPEHAPFDRVIVTAAAAEVPHALMDQLVVGGVMVLPIDRRFWRQELVALERTSDGYRTNYLMDVRFVPLVVGQSGERT
jgi:protein-L-isoaspartate(D-aspartate) O-methyltransferase